MSNMGSSTSYRRAEGETTEWEDILVAKGIIAPKKDPAEEARKAALEDEIERAAASVDPLARKTLDELDELEQDDEDYADSRVLESYRAARLEQIKAAAARNKYGMVRNSGGPCGRAGGALRWGWAEGLGGGGKQASPPRLCASFDSGHGGWQPRMLGAWARCAPHSQKRLEGPSPASLRG